MEDSTAVREFIRTYGTLILATYGVVQVWLIGLWKHFLWNGRLSIFKTGRLEVGYSNFGPTLALSGTLRAERKIVFVRETSITVTKQRDGSIHEFEWTAFRSSQLRIGAADPITIELPSGFNVSPEQPYRYHIFFSDRRTRQELEGPLVKVIQVWRQYLVSKAGQIAQGVGAPGQTPEALAHLYETDFFPNSTEHHEAWDVLSRRNYWEPGSYRLRFVVHTSAPDKDFVAEWTFALTEQDFQNLRLNAVATLREICVGLSQYNFAYPDYV